MAGKILVIEHRAIEGPGTIADFFRDTVWQVSRVSLEEGDSLPKTLDSIDAVISLGGPMNAHEEDAYPFLKDENAFIQKLIKEKIPFLGICLGAQLLAKATGGKVSKAPLKEIGWYGVTVTDEGRRDRLFSDLPCELSVFEWHEDTFQLPKQAVLLAEGGVCRNQGFRVGRNAYGLQFHIEVDPFMVGSWIKAYGIPDDIDGQDMLFEVMKQKEILKRHATMMYLNFARIITQDAAARIA